MILKRYYVYIMGSESRTLYVGITSDLELRVKQHKAKLIPGFTAKYNITQLLWFEEFQSAQQALEFETKIKSWRRSKKLTLIRSLNPEFKDLSFEL
jgi:putative endonuclease